MPHVFIIDEINRGNLSKIFGELLVLIEPDKRKKEWEMPLVYGKSDEKFFVPQNVFLLGLMNSADRSLAVVDYALRRRFAFFDLAPKIASEKFATYLREAGASDEVIGFIQDKIGALNAHIAADTQNLGPGFRIGHSFFCSLSPNTVPDLLWYKTVVRTEIVPLLDEYWFDNPNRAKEWESRLLAGS